MISKVLSGLSSWLVFCGMACLVPVPNLPAASPDDPAFIEYLRVMDQMKDGVKCATMVTPKGHAVFSTGKRLFKVDLSSFNVESWAECPYIFDLLSDPESGRIYGSSILHDENGHSFMGPAGKASVVMLDDSMRITKQVAFPREYGTVRGFCADFKNGFIYVGLDGRGSSGDLGFMKGSSVVELDAETLEERSRIKLNANGWGSPLLFDPSTQQIIVGETSLSLTLLKGSPLRKLKSIPLDCAGGLENAGAIDTQHQKAYFVASLRPGVRKELPDGAAEFLQIDLGSFSQSATLKLRAGHYDRATLAVDINKCKAYIGSETEHHDQSYAFIEEIDLNNLTLLRTLRLQHHLVPRVRAPMLDTGSRRLFVAVTTLFGESGYVSQIDLDSLQETGKWLLEKDR